MAFDEMAQRQIRGIILDVLDIVETHYDKEKGQYVYPSGQVCLDQVKAKEHAEIIKVLSKINVLHPDILCSLVNVLYYTIKIRDLNTDMEREKEDITNLINNYRLIMAPEELTDD
jgi:hypothetical protein